MNALEARLLTLNDERLAALVKGDIGKLELLLDDDLVFIHSSGRTDTKTEYLASLREERLKYVSAEMTEPSVFVSKGTAVLRGPVVSSVISSGLPRVIESFAHTTWLLRPQGWMMLVYSSTPLSGTHQTIHAKVE